MTWTEWDMTEPENVKDLLDTITRLQADIDAWRIAWKWEQQRRLDLERQLRETGPIYAPDRPEDGA